MAEIELYPPLSYGFTEKRAGTWTVEVPVRERESIASLFTRLCAEEPERWGKLFDLKTGRMKQPIQTSLNGKPLSPSSLDSTSVMDTDRIVCKFLIGGG